MKRIYLAKALGLIIGLALLSGAAQAQDNPDHISVPLSDPGRPGTLNVYLMNGSLSIKAYNGKEVTVASRRRGETLSRGRVSPENLGLHRIDNTSSELSIEEENNVVTISRGSRYTNDASLEIQVPVRTNLKLNVTNGGGLEVEGVEGDLEVTDRNGSILLTDVSGSVVANSMNGNVKVSLRRAAPQKPMAFTSMNGTVDVTLPSDTKANVVMHTTNGEIWTDFEVKVNATKPVVSDSRNNNGHYRIELNQAINGSINGGGPEFQFRTTNANIYIRKGK